MKKQLQLAALGIFAGASLFLGGCADSCKTKMTFTEYSPIYMEADAFRSAVRVTAPQILNKPGKIWVYNQYLFVNEVSKGIHIIDNQNPASPQKVGFISIPGNYDLAVKGDKLYTDSSVDLLVFDISNPRQPVLQNRVINTFPHMINFSGYDADPSKGIVVGWEDKIRTETIKSCDMVVPMAWSMNQVPENTNSTAPTDNSNRGATASPTGINRGGSMSRFSIKDNSLYVVSSTELKTYSLQGSDISLSSTQATNRNTETVFAYGNTLFLGANSGMTLYDITSAPNPTQVSSYSHQTSCDPVVSDGRYAYITLHSGADNPCGGLENSLEVVDISQPSTPSRIATWTMTNPKGLGIENDILFIADGKDGLRAFDNSDPTNVGTKQIAQFSDMSGYDVIPNGNTLIMVGSKGINQYDFSDRQHANILSSIVVGQ
jgi:hypothetical protein